MKKDARVSPLTALKEVPRACCSFLSKAVACAQKCQRGARLHQNLHFSYAVLLSVIDFVSRGTPSSPGCSVASTFQNTCAPFGRGCCVITWWTGDLSWVFPFPLPVLGEIVQAAPAAEPGGWEPNGSTAESNPKCSLISKSVCTNELYCRNPGWRSRQSPHHQYCVSRGRRQTAMATRRREVRAASLRHP